MRKLTRSSLRGPCLTAIGLAIAALSHASVPTNAFDYSRSVHQSYDSKGRALTTTIEPSDLSSCSKKTVEYDTKGNLSASTVSNCSGAPASAQFATRTHTKDFGTVAGSQVIAVNGAPVTVSVPAGLFVREAEDAIGSQATAEVDPRFGVIVKTTDPNALVSTTSVDDFGRVVLSVAPDNTKTRTRYCILPASGRETSSNSPGCSAPAEAPALAYAYVETQALGTNDVAISAPSRTFTDAAGRTLRVASRAFDAATQPVAIRGGTVVRDTVYNEFGRPVLTSQPYFLATGSSLIDGAQDMGVAKVEYDVLGRKTAEYVANEQGSQSGVPFGAFGARTAAKATFSYSGLVTSTTNDAGQLKTSEHDAAGRLSRTTDAAGAQIAFRYDAFGNLETVSDAFGNQQKFKHTQLGWQAESVDPDKGTSTYAFDALGQLKEKTNSLQSAPTQFALDAAGRVTSRVDPEYASTWTYDTCAKGQGKLCSTSSTNGISRTNSYDALGRLDSQKTSVASGPSFAWAWNYDNTTGRPSKLVYPSGLAVRPEYTEFGYPAGLRLLTALTTATAPPGSPAATVALAANTLLWQPLAADARGGAISSVVGNGVTTNVALAAFTGQMVGVGAGAASSVLNQSYAWDSLGNLTGRTDHIGDGAGAVTETFVYGDNADNTKNINRLSAYTVAGPGIPGGSRSVELRYNALGMLLYKSDVGAYAYGAQGVGAVRPHAPLSVAGTTFTHDAGGNVVTASSGKYTGLNFTSFNKPASSNGVTGPGASYSWLYDEDYKRLRETRTIASGPNAGTRVQWFMNPDDVGGLGFEREENTPTVASGTNPAVASNRHYINAFGQTIATVVSTGALPTLTGNAPTELATMPAVKLEYWHKDHLGSLAATTDHAGAVTARYAYDPFGKRRQTTGGYDATDSIEVDWGSATLAGTGRGYTGHEHLDDVGLVNMNGRLFDPRAGVFVQADPVRSEADTPQNYAAYAYVLNNPLNSTDPSGFSRDWTTIHRTTMDGDWSSAPSLFRGLAGRLGLGVGGTFEDEQGRPLAQMQQSGMDAASLYGVPSLTLTDAGPIQQLVVTGLRQWKEEALGWRNRMEGAVRKASDGLTRAWWFQSLLGGTLDLWSAPHDPKTANWVDWTNFAGEGVLSVIPGALPVYKGVFKVGDEIAESLLKTVSDDIMAALPHTSVSTKRPSIGPDSQYIELYGGGLAIPEGEGILSRIRLSPGSLYITGWVHKGHMVSGMGMDDIGTIYNSSLINCAQNHLVGVNGRIAVQTNAIFHGNSRWTDEWLMTITSSVNAPRLSGGMAHVPSEHPTILTTPPNRP